MAQPKLDLWRSLDCRIRFYAAARLRPLVDSRRFGRLWRPTKTKPTHIALNRTIGNIILASFLMLFQD